MRVAVTITRRRIARCAALVAVVLAGAAPERRSLDVWVESAMNRVDQDDAVGPLREARVFAGRGEHEPFQVVIRARAAPLRNVNVTVSDLVGAAGHRIARDNLPLFLERYVSVSRSTPSFGRGNRPGPPGLYADGLVPFATAAGRNRAAAPFDVAAGKNQPIWVDLFVPRGIPAGRYTGTVTVTSDQGGVGIPVSLTVWDFELPLEPSLRSSFGLNHVLDKRYQQILVEHRVMPAYVPASDAPGFIDSGGLNVTGLPFWSDRNGCTMKPAPTVAQFTKAIASYPPALDVYAYIADEIKGSPCVFPAVIQWAHNLHRAGARAKSLVTVPPRPELMDDGTGRSAVDIWVMLPHEFDFSDPSYRTARARGNEFWSYNAEVHDDYSPVWEIDFAPINFRIMPGFLSQSLDLTGILYWTVDHWSRDPWSDVYFTDGGLSFPGEGLLLYPGASVGVNGPVPSMRLKWIREGIEDYEYVQMLKGLGRGAFALQVARSVGADWHRWTQDPAALDAARTKLGEELDRLHGRSVPLSGARPTQRRPCPQAGASP